MANLWRWWRVYILDDNGANLVDVGECQFRIAGVNQVGGGTATASSSFAPTLLPPNAFDGNISTRWASDGGGTWPQWLRYDFGLGNDKAIDEMRWAPSQVINRSLKDFKVQCSNDGALWFDALSQTNVTTGWALDTLRSFTFTAPENSGAVADEAQVPQMALLVLWGVSSFPQVSQTGLLVLARPQPRRVIGITD